MPKLKGTVFNITVLVNDVSSFLSKNLHSSDLMIVKFKKSFSIQVMIILNQFHQRK